MGGCEICNMCKHKGVNPKLSPCKSCKFGVGIRKNINYFEPMTNADRIRNMTDEELAEFLDKSLNSDREDCDPIGCYGCAYYGTHHQDKNSEFYECGDCEFEGGLVKWLQAEVKVGEQK